MTSGGVETRGEKKRHFQFNMAQSQVGVIFSEMGGKMKS